MRQPRLSNELLKWYRQLREIAGDLRRIQSNYRKARERAGERLPRFEEGDLSWHCAYLARTSVVRAEELFNAALWSFSGGAVISGVVSLRALYETAGFLILARKKIDSALDDPNSDRLTDALKRLLVGSRYYHDLGAPGAVRPYNVMDMVDALSLHFSEVFTGMGLSEEALRKGYEHLCDVAHPSMGSLDIYSRRRGLREYISRDGLHREYSPFHLIGDLRMMSFVVLSQASELERLGDNAKDRLTKMKRLNDVPTTVPEPIAD